LTIKSTCAEVLVPTVIDSAPYVRRLVSSPLVVSAAFSGLVSSRDRNRSLSVAVATEIVMKSSFLEAQTKEITVPEIEATHSGSCGIDCGTVLLR
jgi:hypothetical protein